MIESSQPSGLVEAAKEVFSSEPLPRRAHVDTETRYEGIDDMEQQPQHKVNAETVGWGRSDRHRGRLREQVRFRKAEGRITVTHHTVENTIMVGLMSRLRTDERGEEDTAEYEWIHQAADRLDSYSLRQWRLGGRMGYTVTDLNPVPRLMRRSLRDAYHAMDFTELQGLIPEE